nr:hypothetical protein [uncultured Caproiciproducens sp.]
MDRKIAEYLKGFHSGEDRAISSRDLAKAFGISGRALRDIVNHLRVGRLISQWGSTTNTTALHTHRNTA